MISVLLLPVVTWHLEWIGIFLMVTILCAKIISWGIQHAKIWHMMQADERESRWSRWRCPATYAM